MADDSLDLIRMEALNREEYRHLRRILLEFMKTSTRDALECDVATAPSRNAGDVCRAWTHSARIIRAKLRPK